MVFRWTAENERLILMLSLRQHTKFTPDAEAILAALPDDEKPTARSIRERLSQLRSQAEVFDFTTGWKYGKNPIVPGAGARITTTTPTRRPSTAVKSISEPSLSASSLVTPTNTNGSTTPATPFTTSKFKSALPTVNGGAVARVVETANTVNGTSTGFCRVIDVSTFKQLTSSNCKGKGTKRKAGKISTSDNESTAPDTDNDTSEDEFLTPTKLGINPTSLIGMTTPHDRRVSLRRRSKFATPAVYATLDDDDDTGLDDAAKDVSSSEEYNANEDKGGRKLTPNGKRIGWRDRVERPGADEEDEE